MMKMELQPEHRWLQKLVGEWTFEGEAIMPGSEPGQPPTKFSGTEIVRPIGGLWVVGEGRGDTPEGETVMMVTLGYDHTKQRFVGTFVASMETHMWVYSGTLDASGKVLTLDTEGPNMGAGGKMAPFQDIVEVPNDNLRILRSRMLGDDGKWIELMTATYRRKV